MKIDEVIKLTKQHNKCQYSEAKECLSEEDCTDCDKYYDEKKWDEFCKQLPNLLEELKAYKELDFEIPQHFTKEQSDWIKAYVILKKKEAKVDAIDECIGIVNTYKSNWYRDIDGDWVEPKCNAKTLIEKMIELQKE